MNTSRFNFTRLFRSTRQARAGAMACALAVAAACAAPQAHAHRFGPTYNLAGTWRVTVTTFNCATLVENPAFQSYLTFGAEGSLVETTANPVFQPGQRSPGHGFWERNGRNFYRAVSEAYILFTTAAPLPPFQRGYQRLDQGIQMTGRNSFESDASITFFNSAGAVVLSGCARATGERFE